MGVKSIFPCPTLLLRACYTSIGIIGGIENRLHWRRDVTLGEDRCQTRTGAAPGTLARLNSAILSLMDRLGVHNVAHQARFFDARVDQAVQALLSGRCSVY